MVISTKNHSSPSSPVRLLGYSIWMILLFGLLSSFQKCSAYDVTTSCPSTFTDSTNAILSCFVNKTYINAASCGTRPIVSFVFTSSSTGSTTMCSSPYPSRSCGTLPTGIFPCGCTNESGDLYTFQYNFTAIRAFYENGSITCAVRCSLVIITYFHEATCSSLVYAQMQLLCRPDQTMEIVKEKADNAFTCTYSPANLVIWRVSVTTNSDLTVIVLCEINKLECRADGYPEIFSANMTATKSVINFNTVSLNPENILLFGRGTLSCETRNSSTLPGPKSEWQLDYIYKPEMISCNAQFITNGTDGLVIGKCIIEKVFSYRDRYACMWNEINGMLTTAIPNNQTTLKKTLISGTNVDDVYYSVECSFSKPLPEKSGNYIYTVIVYPGDVHLTVNCTGSNSIGAPRIIPDSPMPKEITFYGDPVPVIFEVIAYPQITEAYIKLIDNASIMISSDVNMKFPLMCDESSLLYTTLCILVIKNATSADVGTYQMTLINGIGELAINIKVFVNIKDNSANCQENRNECLSPGAGAGITLAAEAVVAALVIVILWRKGFIFNCRDKHADRSIKTNSEVADLSNMKNDMHVESCLGIQAMSAEARTNSHYEGLRVGEIGLPSAYESIKQETKCVTETGETLQTHDIGAESQYDSF